MAGVFQMSSGYRDPAKSMTIKALEARLKAQQEASAQATQMQQPISDPMQGYAYLGNILSSGIKEATTEYRSGAARDELAKIKAGIDWNKGPDAQQYAEMSRLDPEGADKIMQDWVNYRQDLEKQAKQQEFQTGERVAGQEFTTGERVGGQEFTAGQQTSRQTFEAGQTEDQQRHAIELAEQNQQMDVAEQKRQEQQKVDVIAQETEARKAEWLRLNPSGDINSQEAQAYILRDAAPTTGGLNSPTALKDINEFKLQGTQMDSALDTVNRAEELMNGGNVVGGDAAMKVFELAGSVPGGTAGLKWALDQIGVNLTEAQIADTMEFDSIMGLGATEHMANTLKGQTSNMEMAAFRRDMANRNAPDAVKRNAIQRMKNALLTDRGALDSTLQSFNQPAMNPYEYKSSRTVAPVVPSDSNTTTPPSAGSEGGGGGQRDPATMTPAEREKERRELMGQ